MPATLMKYPSLENHIVMRPAWFEHLQCEKNLCIERNILFQATKVVGFRK